MYGMLPAYHTRRSYVTLCEALCVRPRHTSHTLLASAWPQSLCARKKVDMGDIRAESGSSSELGRYPVLISPLTESFSNFRF
jgi:hypothetical protein